MHSIWENAQPPKFEQLKENKKTDVLIIGGGIAGILCAYKLKEKGVDCILVEAGRICGGITKNTTAKITVQHGLIYRDLIDKFGHKKAQLYLKAQLKALEEYEKLCKNIDCDFEKKNSYVYSLNNREKIKKEVEAINLLGLKAEFCECKELGFKTQGAVLIKNQAQFNPLKFLYALAKGLPIYENTKVLHLMTEKAVIDGGQISCKKIIIAMLTCI